MVRKAIEHAQSGLLGVPGALAGELWHLAVGQLPDG